MIWLIGAGSMSIDYVKVLNGLKRDFIVVGRSKASADKFERNTGQAVLTGGLKSFLSTSPVLPEAVIVSVSLDELYNTSIELLKYGVKRILVEKPGGIFYKEIEALNSLTLEKKAQLYVAYNRRYYSSVLEAQKLIQADGGVTSFNFELTEWSHAIEKLDKKVEVFENWFVHNSTHVADLAFFLGGKPDEFSAYTTGRLSWHSRSAIFSGAGVSVKGALFSYGADWSSAGRWSVEILTKENRYIFRPMESLSCQKRGTVNQELVDIDDSLDIKYKPGLFKQVEDFLSGGSGNLCSIESQLSLFSIYKKMANYS